MKIEQQVLKLTSEYFDIPISQIKGKKQGQKEVVPRACITRCLRAISNLSLVDIGKVLGGRDHSTLLNYTHKDLFEYKDYFEYISNNIKRVMIIQNSQTVNKKAEGYQNRSDKIDFKNYLRSRLERNIGRTITPELIDKIFG